MESKGIAEMSKGASMVPNKGQPPTFTKQFSHHDLIKLGEKYPKLKLIQEAIHDENLDVNFGETTAKYQIYIRNVKRKYLNIAILCLLAIVISLAFIILDVYIKFGDVVSMFNKYRSDDMPSGFELGLALRIPALRKWLNFKTASLPEAVFISYKSVSFHNDFMSSPSSNLVALFHYAMWMGGGGGTTNPSAISLVCNSWLYQSGTVSKPCEKPCPPGSGGYASSYVSDVMSGLSQTAMLGEMGSVAVVGSLAGMGANIAGTAGAYGDRADPSHCIGSDSMAGCSIM